MHPTVFIEPALGWEGLDCEWNRHSPVFREHTIADNTAEQARVWRVKGCDEGSHVPWGPYNWGGGRGQQGSLPWRSGTCGDTWRMLLKVIGKWRTYVDWKFSNNSQIQLKSGPLKRLCLLGDHRHWALWESGCVGSSHSRPARSGEPLASLNWDAPSVRSGRRIWKT